MTPRAVAAETTRKVLQLSSLAFIVASAFTPLWRNYRHAHNNARLVELMHGEIWAEAYRLYEHALSLLGDPFEISATLGGIPWASAFFGFVVLDPVLGLAHVARFGPELPVLFGILIPVGLAVLLGKIFCSHLCPMRLFFEGGQWVRAGLLRLGFPLLSFRHEAQLGGFVLIGGLIGTLTAGMSIWLFILPYAALGATAVLAVIGGSLSALMGVPIAWLTVDALLAPGAFCRNLCPTGFVLGQLGRYAPWRIRKAASPSCPATCHVCKTACPYGLSPRDGDHDLVCDRCGACAAICPKQKLSRGLARLPIVVGLLLAFGWSSEAEAHHNKGLPHYGYYENYPQVPTEEHVTVRGRWEMGATIFNFQGYTDRRSSDTPRDVKFFVYLYDLKGDGPYLGAVTFDLLLDRRRVAGFQRASVDEENIYTTRETLPESGEYELQATLTDLPTKPKVSLFFEIDLEEDAVNVWLLTAFAAPVLVLVVLALLGRTPRGRRLARAATMSLLAGVTVGSAGLACRPSDPAISDEHHHSALVTRHSASQPSSQPASQPASQAASQPALVTRHAASQPSGQPASQPVSQPLDAHAPPPSDSTPANAGSETAVMAGMPATFLLVGVLLLLAISFVVVERRGLATPSAFRLNLVRRKRTYRVLKHPLFQTVPQLLAVGVFLFLMYAGLFGNRGHNITPVAVWTLWWGGLIFAVLLAGPIFCFACPWDGLANVFTRMGLGWRKDRLSLGLPVPRVLQTMWPAILLFALLSWAELGLAVTSDPRGTAYMGLGMATLAVGSALLFEKKAFCRFWCPVGRIIGVYSLFSPVEVRSRNPKVCARCKTEECLNGREGSDPCPTGLSLKTLQVSSYCTGCTECLRSCEKNNVALNIRPFGSDVARVPEPPLELTWLCLSLLALTLFHGFSMTTIWESFRPGESSVIKALTVYVTGSHWMSFTLGMIAACAIPVGLYALSCRMGARLGGSTVPASRLFREYALSLLPIALFYHLAHNLMHVAMEASHVVPLLSDPLGTGANLLGTASLHPGHLIGELPLWYMQTGLIVAGHLFGIFAAHRISRRLYADERSATRSLIPMLLVMILISAAGLGLMVLDMNMRVGRM